MKEKKPIKTLRIHIFGTLLVVEITWKITKRVPKYATVRSDTQWIYKGLRLKVDSVYMEESRFDDPGSGRRLRLSLEGTPYPESHGYTTTVIPERDLILEY